MIRHPGKEENKQIYRSYSFTRELMADSQPWIVLIIKHQEIIKHHLQSSVDSLGPQVLYQAKLAARSNTPFQFSKLQSIATLMKELLQNILRLTEKFFSKSQNLEKFSICDLLFQVQQALESLLCQYQKRRTLTEVILSGVWINYSAKINVLIILIFTIA